MSVRVTNIQRMCFDDGPGIRTTVFLKGCSIHCPWCSNPENISFEKQRSLTGNEYGTDYEAQELVRILEKDRVFWGSDGGVTFSGGEALMQSRGLREVWESLKADGIHLAVETALFVPEDLLAIAIEYIDFYYIDVKLLEESLCVSVLGGDVNLYKRNVAKLAEEHKDIHFRVPCSGEYVLREENRRALIAFLKKYSRYPVEIFSLHDLGREKYRSLGLEMPDFEKLTEQYLEIFRTELLREGCKAEIIHI